MKQAWLTSIPYDNKEYCDRNKRLRCASRIAADEDDPAAREAAAIGQQLRQSPHQKPVSDQDNYGKRDYWTIPVKGDCEDYVPMKRAQLMARGISPSQLLITMVQGSEPHVVLTARTDHGDYIPTDNLRDEVLPVEKTENAISRCSRLPIPVSGFPLPGVRSLLENN